MSQIWTKKGDREANRQTQLGGKIQKENKTIKNIKKKKKRNCQQQKTTNNSLNNIITTRSHGLSSPDQLTYKELVQSVLQLPFWLVQLLAKLSQLVSGCVPLEVVGWPQCQRCQPFKSLLVPGGRVWLAGAFRSSTGEASGGGSPSVWGFGLLV